MPGTERIDRSELVRRRRMNRTRRPVKTGSSRRQARTQKSTLPNVTVRSGLFYSAVQTHHRGKGAKRRYDVALSTEGAEIRLPALPSLALGWRLLSGILVAILGFALYSLFYSPLFQVGDIQVEGLRRLTKQDLNTVADILYKSVLFVDPEEVQTALLAAFPDLESVEVDVGVPAKVTMTTRERRPVLVWDRGGAILWVDASGFTFPPRGEDGPVVRVVAESLPTLPPSDEEGPAALSRTEVLPVDLVEAVLAMAEMAPENTPIIYDRDHGLGWQDALGWQVFFGMDTKEMDEKLNVYRVLAKRLKKQEPRPQFVSVEYLHAPYYRLER